MKTFQAADERTSCHTLTAWTLYASALIFICSASEILAKACIIFGHKTSLMIVNILSLEGRGGA